MRKYFLYFIVFQKVFYERFLCSKKFLTSVFYAQSNQALN